VSADVPDVGLLHEAAETFAMLASPTRLHLLWLLSRGECDVGTLAEAVDGSDAMVSQHLAKLRLADLVTACREGKRQIYVVDDDQVSSLIEQALDHHGRRHRRARRCPRAHRRVGGQTLGAGSVVQAGIDCRDSSASCVMSGVIHLLV
jgi:DNA-binding transcriptional ArsR family regulator